MPSAHRVIYLLLAILLLANLVAALNRDEDDEKDDKADDFFNNIASDLKEYLALFADHFTMQFLSQCLTTSDYILAATMSVGPMTTAVSAIRAGGPQWLRALVGRATENTAAAELEVMSSTSRDVSELFNGTEVVRCLGKAPVYEYIFLTPDTSDADLPTSTRTREASMNEVVEQGYMTKVSDAREKNLWRIARALIPFGSSDKQDDTPEVGSKGNTPSQGTKGILVRIIRPESPNISLNRSKNTARGELHTASGFGILVFLAFTIYSYLITCHPTISSGYLKDGQSVPFYAFACIFFGSLLSHFGSYISAYVVGSSTKEEVYRPAKGWRATMVWVQDKTVLGDQEFESFAFFTGKDQPNIITSSRIDKEQDSGLLRRQLEKLTFGGVLSIVIGSALMSIGFQKSHWSVLAAYVTAVLVMLVVKILVRRQRVKPLRSQLLIPGSGLPWLSDSLRHPSSAPWLNNREELSNKSSRAGARSLSYEMTGGATDDPDPDEAQECTRRLQSLVRLADLPSPVSQEATRVAEAIEEVMGILHKASSRMAFTWTKRVQAGSSNIQSLKYTMSKQSNGKWKVDVGLLAATLSLEEFYASWRSKAEARSPSVYPEADDERPNEKRDIPNKRIRILGAHGGSLLKHLRWWTPPDGLQILLGQAKYIAAEDSDATDDGGYQNHFAQSVGKFEVEESSVLGLDPRLNTVSLLSHGVAMSCPKIPEGNQAVADPETAFGCPLQLPSSYSKNSGGGKWEFTTSERDIVESTSEGSGCVLFVETCDSLPVFFAKDMLATFIWAAIEALEGPLAGETTISQEESEAGEFQGLGEQCNLENSIIQKLVRCVQRTGLFSKSEAYHSIILPLIIQKKLPEASIVVEKVRDSAKRHEACRHWDEAVAEYLWLSNNMDAFPAGSCTFIKAAAALVAFQTALEDTLDPMLSMAFGTTPEVADRLEKSLEGIDPELMKHLRSLCKLEDADGWRQSLSNASQASCSQYTRLLLNSYEIFEKERTNSQWCAQTSAREQDIFDRTPLHYLAAFVSDENCAREKANVMRVSQDEAELRKFRQRVGALIDYGNSVDACDLRGWTPLHYACRSGNTSMARLLFEKGASIDAQSRDGTAPVHFAAEGGHWQMVQLLMGFRANVGVVDGGENTALHAAALRGYAKIVRSLCEGGCRSRRNRLGQAPIHLAAIQGQAEVVEHLQDDVGLKDFRAKTPLQLAAELGHNTFVKRLLELPKVQVELLLSAKLTSDELRLTPLYLACEGGHDDVVETLLSRGAPINGLGRPFETPLFVALQKRKESTVRLLVNRGANLELRDERGRTLLHWAIEERNTAAAMLLLGLEADVQAANHAKETPQMIAERVGLTQWWRDNISVSA